jgi:2'-5' RNA ligase
MTEPAAVTRLFIALWPTPALRQRLVAHQAAWNWPARTALTAHEHLHLTLHFIGAVPTSRLDEIQQGLRVDAPRIALALDSFEVCATAARCAGQAARPSLWRRCTLLWRKLCARSTCRWSSARFDRMSRWPAMPPARRRRRRRRCIGRRAATRWWPRPTAATRP